jgi:hypothetical protein
MVMASSNKGSDKPRKYLIFEWPEHEASGGIDDLIGSADTVEEAQGMFKGPGYGNCAHVVDRDTLKVVCERWPGEKWTEVDHGNPS